MKGKLIATRVTDDVKAQFKAFCVSRGTTETDSIREFIYKEIGRSDLLIPDKTSSNKELGRRWKVVNTRLSTSEWKVLQPIVQAEVHTVSSWLLELIRSRILAGVQLNDKEIEALERSTYQLRGIGRNLNQVVRAINEGKVKEANVSPKQMAQLTKRIDEAANLARDVIANAKERHF